MTSGAPIRAAYDVAAVRAAEALVMAQPPGEALMARAAAGLARTCALLLRAAAGGVYGAQVAVLVGSGNNGGDALWAAAGLAARGAGVTAVLLTPVAHPAGLAALQRAGGRVRDATGQAAPASALDAVRGADLVLDGIVGIGGSGPLRPVAAALAAAALASSGVRVAVDLPSGIDADTGAVPDPSAVFVADVTVTFGTAKPGLLLMPAAEFVGVLEVVDIGLGSGLVGPPALEVLDGAAVRLLLRAPDEDDHKYSRGVVGVAAGSRRYPGAGLLCVGGARRGGAGMVALRASPSESALVMGTYPDVVNAAGPGQDPRVGVWVAGPGLGDSAAEAGLVREVLGTAGPVLLDADALTLLAHSPQVAHALAERSERGGVTVMTPHDGEFARLGHQIGAGADEDRAGAARRAARDRGVVVLLKGARTVVAEPGGRAWVNVMAGPELATAGSGDVLAGLTASMLAAVGPTDAVTVARTVAAGAWLHGFAGRVAAHGGRPVTAVDLVAALPEAVARTRAGDL